jgi:hypothetical protein
MRTASVSIHAEELASRSGASDTIRGSVMYRSMLRGRVTDLSARNSSQKCQITFHFGMAFINDTGMNGVTFCHRIKKF